jgi:hypothetical protein
MVDPFAKYKIMKSSRMRLAGHVAQIREKSCVYFIGRRAGENETDGKTET